MYECSSYIPFLAHHEIHRQPTYDDAIWIAPRYAIQTSHHTIHNQQGKLQSDARIPVILTMANSAFQRLGFAFEILKSPSARRTYDRASKPRSSQLADKTEFLGGDHTFRGAVEAILQEFMTGDFVIVRRWLESLHAQYPNLVSKEVVINVEKSFIRIRELVLTTRTYALLIYIELGRIHRVQKRLMGLGYLDVVGRTKLSIHLVRVTLAVPMRVDRALKQREERAWRAKSAGLQAAGIDTVEGPGRAGILNDRVSQVLEFIVGSAGKDEGADEAWGSHSAQAGGC